MLVHITDQLTDRRYLVDTGASFSLVPHRSASAPVGGVPPVPPPLPPPMRSAPTEKDLTGTHDPAAEDRAAKRAILVQQRKLQMQRQQQQKKQLI